MRRAALIGLLALAGCGGSATPAPPPEVPAGFARYDGQGVSFDRPSAWTREEPEPGQVGFYGEPGEGGLPPQVAIGDAPARNELDDVVRLHKDTQKIRFPSYRVTQEEAVKLPGATAAHLIDAEYTMAKPRSKVLVREVNLLVLTDDGRQLDFFVRSPAADYAGAKLGTVFDSFRLR
jgi:hypothetical protein